jgi:hypothetical protein
MDAAHEAQDGVQFRLGVPCGEVEVLAAALGIESGGDGDGLDQRGLAAAILTDEERDLWVQVQRVECAAGTAARD